MARWIVIAYLYGMRDAEVRALTQDCATTTVSLTGRTRHKITGRVFKHRKLTGDNAEWIVLGVVHEAVDVLKEINNDPGLLFGHTPPRPEHPAAIQPPDEPAQVPRPPQRPVLHRRRPVHPGCPRPGRTGPRRNREQRRP